MTALFISYSRADANRAERLAEDLGRAGHSVWLDREALVPGTDRWKQSVEEAIEAAEVVIVVLTPNAKASRWVSLEISYATEFGRPVLPWLVDGDVRHAVPIELVETQRIDGRGDYSAALVELLAAIPRCTGAGTVSRVRSSSAELPLSSRSRYLPWIFIASIVCAWVGSLALAGTLAHDFDAAYVSAAAHSLFYSTTFIVFFIGAALSALAGAASLRIRFTRGVLQGWVWPVLAAFAELLLLFGAIRLITASGMGEVMSEVETLLALFLLGTLGPAFLTVMVLGTLRELQRRTPES